MKRGFNELVGLQVTFSRVIPRYRVRHHYRRTQVGQEAERGTMTSFNLDRHCPIKEIMRGFEDAYAPAIKAIWENVAKGSFSAYYQFGASADPGQVHLPGPWHKWAEK